MIFDTISVKARWERWCRWNCDLRVKNARKKRHFLSYRKRRHDAQITWPYAYYVTLGSRCKMANSSSEDETDTLPERPTRIQPYQFEPVRQDFERVPEHRVSFEANPMRYSMGFAKSHSLKCSLHKWAWCGAARKSARLKCINLSTFASLRVDCAGARALLYLGSSANCYSSRKHSRLTFLSTTRIHSLLKNLRWQPHWLPRLTSLPGKPTENKID